MPQVIETFQEFKDRQGCECVYVRERWLFANGAESNQEQHVEPPSDEIALLLLRHEFLKAIIKAKIARYQHDHKAIKTAIYYESVNAGPGPDEGWQQHLEKLVGEIEALQTELAQVTERLPHVQRMRQLEAERDVRMNRGKEKMTTLQQFPTY